MTSSTRKIVAGALSIAMVLTLVVGFAAVPAKADTTVTTTTTTSAVYTRDLTVGSTGADVTSLQSMLYSAGYLKVAPTGYFGSLTQAALAAWQASVGISPASGYFGPITRAYIASMTTTSTSTVAGCSAGSIHAQPRLHQFLVA
jgi:peptidoglycan hydrolase-like protein with peptidoglycan-binding domain